MPTVFVSAMSTKMLPPNFEYDDVSDKVWGYEKIFKGKRGSELVALKAMDYVDFKDIKKEAKFLMKLNHPNVVQVKGVCLSESSIMMEFMILDLKPYRSNTHVHSANDLLMKLSKPACHGYELIILQLAQGIPNGLIFLHEMSVSHSALKPSNILVSNPKDDFGVLQVRLSYFGESWEYIVQATRCMKTHTTYLCKYLIQIFYTYKYL